jgi:hypothetical protein
MKFYNVHGSSNRSRIFSSIGITTIVVAMHTTYRCRTLLCEEPDIRPPGASAAEGQCTHAG